MNLLKIIAETAIPKEIGKVVNSKRIYDDNFLKIECEIENSPFTHTIKMSYEDVYIRWAHHLGGVSDKFLGKDATFKEIIESSITQ